MGQALRVGVGLVAVVGAILLLPEARSHARGQSGPAQIEGTGRFESLVVRTTETLDPPCVSLVTRVGRVAFTGFISNALEDSHFDSRALRDACTSSVQGTARQTYDLLGATVNGRTGHLRIEADGIFEGDATTPPGTRHRFSLKIVGLGGDLEGAEGEGQAVGGATSFPGEPAISSTTYHVRIRFK
jgi:hypothetical protein